MMQRLSRARVPLSWLLLTIIAVAGLLILWELASRAEPANSVLIEKRPVQEADPIGGGDRAVGLDSQPGSMQTAAVTPTSPTPAEIAVYVSGSVFAPDVYTLPAEARAKDAIEAAGGATPNADLRALNLAARLRDEQHLHVPRIGENASTAAVAPTEVTNAESTPSPEPRDTLVDLNTADAAELEALPGIGPALARRIIDYRTSNGPFRTIEDLMQVPGIKEGIFAKLRPFVTVSP